jgi:hypothetical protein
MPDSSVSVIPKIAAVKAGAVEGPGHVLLAAGSSPAGKSTLSL